MAPEAPTIERWRQIEGLYHAALELRPEEREAFLDAACESDGKLRHDVESLLASYSETDSFLATPPGDVVAAMIAEERLRSMTGRTLGHYKVQSLLGSGGMGEVYRARDTRLDRDVAVKILPEHLAADPDALRRFEREAKAVAALSHPNILAIFDFGSDEGVKYAVMELLEGETLRDRLRRSTLDWREAVKIGIAIAEGLVATHAKGIIHRDLKPANIFLTNSGQVKILDFGIARIQRPVSPNAETLTSTLSEVTRTDQTPGTPGYMSPEQLRGEKADAPSDIFSLGCVIYEMLSGERPFAHKTFAEIMAATLKDEPPSLRQRGACAIPAELEQIIGKAMRKERHDRYQSAEDLLRDLRNLRLEDRAKPGVWPRIRVNLRAGITIGVAVLALGGVAAYRTWFQNPAGRKNEMDSTVSILSRLEVMRYHLEVESESGEITRATGAEPLLAGDSSSFRFHFKPHDRGYLYIVAPSQNNIPTTFLTALPDADTGVTTNLIEAGADYEFPAGAGNGIALGQIGATTIFTIIYSPAPLAKPEFLAARAYQQLTAGEQHELESLRRKFGQQTPEALPQTEGNQTSMMVTMAANRPGNLPLIFDIPIKHR